jgi:hypothetical protein
MSGEVTCEMSLASGDRVPVEVSRLSDGGELRVRITGVLVRVVERQIAEGSKPGAEVTCPGFVPNRAGETFECRVSVPGHADGLVRVTEQDNEGNGRWETVKPPDPLEQTTPKRKRRAADAQR